MWLSIPNIIFAAIYSAPAVDQAPSQADFHNGNVLYPKYKDADVIVPSSDDFPFRKVIQCGANDNFFVSYVYDCSSFIYCNHGVKTFHTCPRGQVFSDKQQRCIDGRCKSPNKEKPPVCQSGVIVPKNKCGKVSACVDGEWKNKKCQDDRAFVNGQCSATVFCHQHNPDDDFKPSPVVTTPIPPALCAEGEAYVHKKDCSRYVICLEGQLYEYQCRQGALFDPSRRLCVFDYTCPHQPGYLTTTTPPPVVQCATEDPRPHEDCQKYVVCRNGVNITFTCEPQHHFSRHALKCIPGPTCRKIITRPFCRESPGKDGFRPHPYDCTKFFQCAQGRWIQKDCAPGTGFAPNLGVCDHVGNVPSCTDQGEY